MIQKSTANDRMKSQGSTVCDHAMMHGAYRGLTIKYYDNRWFRQELSRPALAAITPTKPAPSPTSHPPKWILLKKAA